MLFAATFPPAQRACNFDTSADRTVGSAVVCDRLRLYGNNSLYDRLRSAIYDPRSSAIIWKPGLRFELFGEGNSQILKGTKARENDQTQQMHLPGKKKKCCVERGSTKKSF